MNLLAFGDVCGEAGLRIACGKLRALKKYYGADVCVINGENADVLGIKPEQARRLFEGGADIVTLGNHVWNRLQIKNELEENRFLLRPHNLSPRAPGAGYVRLPLNSGRRLVIVCLVGRLECVWNADSPFHTLETLMREYGEDVFAVDFHAEATSEKAALAHCFDGRAAAVFGTHTHVQTSDERVLPGGTGFITDLGMTGPRYSVLGVKVEQSVSTFLGDVPSRYESPDTEAVMEGAVFAIDEVSGKCTGVERIRVEE
ncbi:MAG: YmdB family metallophosphoesterase [Oscillospiraceae bacterium]|jgi:metallophosphoesterase (TIGR00282 family)|nr:YmdB family metallophosphoesterase [Oscillospiraceae bacterium]